MALLLVVVAWMVRFKNRYLVVVVHRVGEEDDAAEEGAGKRRKKRQRTAPAARAGGGGGGDADAWLTARELHAALAQSIEANFGEWALGGSLAALAVRYADAPSGVAVVRTARDAHCRSSHSASAGPRAPPHWRQGKVSGRALAESDAVEGLADGSSPGPGMRCGPLASRPRQPISDDAAAISRAVQRSVPFSSMQGASRASPPPRSRATPPCATARSAAAGMVPAPEGQSL